MAYATRIPTSSPTRDASTSNLTHGVSGSSSGATSLRRPEWLPEEQWPFQTVGIDHEGRCLAVTDVGRGPTLLFVHTGFWSFIWRDVMLRLKASYRCIAIDAPGTGLSERLPAELITLDRSAQAVRHLIEQLNQGDLVLVLHDLAPRAQQAVIANGNHFPMCDNPQMTAVLIRSWHQENVMPRIIRK